MMRSNSVSSISSGSSRASSPEVEDTIQIFVKDLSGNTFPITVPYNTTISTLQSLLALRTNLPQTSLRLVFAGKHLSPSATLTSSNITSSSTLHLTLPLRGGMAPKRPKCEHNKDKEASKRCTAAAQPIIGDCGFCGGHFCSKHRQLEDHSCTGLEDCKKESRERNADKLISERTVAIRGV